MYCLRVPFQYNHVNVGPSCYVCLTVHSRNMFERLYAGEMSQRILGTYRLYAHLYIADMSYIYIHIYTIEDATHSTLPLITPS